MSVQFTQMGRSTLLDNYKFFWDTRHCNWLNQISENPTNWNVIVLPTFILLMELSNVHFGGGIHSQEMSGYYLYDITNLQEKYMNNCTSFYTWWPWANDNGILVLYVSLNYDIFIYTRRIQTWHELPSAMMNTKT